MRDPLADMNGDRIAGFGIDDALDITGSLIDRSDLTVTNGPGTTTLSADGSTVLLDGGFPTGDFMTVARGTDADTHTIVTFENFLPTFNGKYQCRSAVDQRRCQRAPVVNDCRRHSTPADS